MHLVGVDVKGCDSCWQQCDLNHTPTSTSWWYTSQKNKSKIVKARIARTGKRVDVKAIKVARDDT
jgi:hypothetical protein